MFETLLKVKRERRQNRERILSRILALMDACDTLGLDKMERNLDTIYDSVKDEFDAYDAAIDTDLDAGLKQVQQNSANVLKAVLAGTEITKCRS